MADVTELRPPPEHADLAQHLCRWAEDGEEYVLTWHPAEWRKPLPPGVALYPEPFVDGLKERIAILETEIEALRVEKRYMLARMDEWRVGLPPAPPYPRAHDLGMGRREPVWVTLGSDAPTPIAGMVAAALAPRPLPPTHATPLPASAIRRP